MPATTTATPPAENEEVYTESGLPRACNNTKKPSHHAHVWVVHAASERPPWMADNCCELRVPVGQKSRAAAAARGATSGLKLHRILSSDEVTPFNDLLLPLLLFSLLLLKAHERFGLV